MGLTAVLHSRDLVFMSHEDQLVHSEYLLHFHEEALSVFHFKNLVNGHDSLQVEVNELRSDLVRLTNSTPLFFGHALSETSFEVDIARASAFWRQVEDLAFFGSRRGRRPLAAH